MHPQNILRQLKINAQRIHALVEGVDEEQARWKPDADSWSILEVINHLLDEERYDFRVRIDYILHRPGEDPPPIDPQGWVSQRNYNARDWGESLLGFMEERRKSIAWLESLQNPDWEAAYRAPWGVIRAGELYVAWSAHDLLHMRQLVELHYAHAVQLSAPYSVEYAGRW